MEDFLLKKDELEKQVEFILEKVNSPGISFALYYANNSLVAIFYLWLTWDCPILTVHET